MQIRTERLLLRHVVPEDWPCIREIWLDFNRSAYACYDMPHHTEEADVRTRIARWAEACSGGEHVFFVVCLPEEVVGYVAFNIRESGYEIGYCFHSRYHGFGYARESIEALMQHMHAQYGVTCFIARTALANAPSTRLLTRLGFRQTGTEQVSFYQDAQGNPVHFDGGIYELTMA